MKIDQSIIDILAKSRVEGNLLYLPPQQLDRATYTKVNKVLESIKGAWNRKLKAHVFESDIEEILADIINTGEYVDKKKELQYFPTPKEIVVKMIELAELKAGETVLEPSCGKGNIISEVIKITNNVDGIEIDKENYSYVVKEFGASYGMKSCDFLKHDDTKRYDKIIMNPPFHTAGLAQADISHILHAWKFLKVGGILVSIVSESPFFRENKKSQEFRDWIEENNGRTISLEQGAFKESGTMAKTRILVIKKKI